MSHDSTFPGRVDDALFERYLAGECTEDEQALVHRHLANNAVDGALVRQLLTRGTGPASAEIDRAWSRLGEAKVWRGRSVVRKGQKQLWWIAGAVCAVGMSWLGTSRFMSVPDQTHRYHTTAGQRTTIRLANGSTMTLGPASSATIVRGAITVTGEAYFTVVPDPSHPFIVRTTNASVRVLGTRFAVRHYAGESQSQVVVDDGRVALQRMRGDRLMGASTVLSARMLAHVADSGMTVTSGITTREYIGWAHGTLVFNWVPLRDVLGELSRAYGADIRVDDSVLATRKLRIDITVTEIPLSQILRVIGDVAEAHVVRDGKAFLLAPGRIPNDTDPTTRRHNHDPQPETQYGK